MSSLATPWLDLTVACQRNTLKRTTYLTARPPFDPSRFGVEPIDTADARTFIETHHHSGTFPVEIASYGLFESKPNARAALVGVAVFSIPVNTPAALTALLEPGRLSGEKCMLHGPLPRPHALPHPFRHRPFRPGAVKASRRRQRRTSRLCAVA